MGWMLRALFAGVLSATVASLDPGPRVARVRLPQWGLSSLEQVRRGELTLTPTQAYLSVLRSESAGPAPLPPPVVPPAAPGPRRPARPACWLWNTLDLFSEPARQEAVAWLKGEGVVVVFVQVPAAPGPQFAKLVESLRDDGLEVQALDGNREDVLPERQPEVLERLERLLGSSARASLTGVHYDVEPYLNPGFGGARRTELLAGYLGLVREVSRRVHGAGLELTLSVPVWFDGGEFQVDGEPLLRALLREADHLALMDYRTELESILESARTELDLAAAAGRTVWVGLETAPLEDEESYEFGGEPAHGQPASYPVVAARQDEESAVFWLAHEDAPPLHWPVLARHRVPAERLTFARSSGGRLQTTLRELTRHLETHPGFEGWAVHELRTWRDLVHREDRQ